MNVAFSAFKVHIPVLYQKSDTREKLVNLSGSRALVSIALCHEYKCFCIHTAYCSPHMLAGESKWCLISARETVLNKHSLAPAKSCISPMEIKFVCELSFQKAPSRVQYKHLWHACPVKISNSIIVRDHPNYIIKGTFILKAMYLTS